MPTRLIPAALALAALAISTPQREPEGLIAPRIDGPLDRTEWARAGRFLALEEATTGIEGLLFGWNDRTLFLAVQHAPGLPPPQLRLWRVRPDLPGGTEAIGVLHLDSDGRARLDLAGNTARPAGVQAARGRGSLEVALPCSALGLEPGQRLLLQAETAAGRFPEPALGVTRPDR